ncbi:MAG TPA: hypothetical protein VFF16_19290 [Telluria sp.]|nr:hypothetical protein [Telluria sp.]
MLRRLTRLLGICCLLCAPLAHAQRIVLETEDRAPQFLAWYAAAQNAKDADERWALWESMYHEAAVPPTPQGKLLARRLVDAAWPRYASALPAAKAGTAAVAPAAAAALEQAAATLGLETPARIRLKGIIAAFERNAFAYRADIPVLVVPLETIGQTPLALAHEGTHAVHMALNRDGGGFERALAFAALQEGLAMHVACRLVSGATPAQCVGGRPDFWEQMQEKRQAILQGALPDLARADAATLVRYTMGSGSAGLPRELYALGWFVVERLLADGMTPAQLARVPERDAARLVGDTVALMLKPASR